MTDITMDVDTKALRQRILTLAIQGKLTDQRKEDGNARDLYNQIQEEKQKLIKEKKIKKAKPLPKIEEDEIPFDIPENWMWVRFLDILDIRDGTHDTPQYVPKGVPLITGKNISKGYLDFSTAKQISYEDAKKINKRSKVDYNDIIFAMIGTIGNPIIIKENVLFSIKNVALLKHFSDLIDMDYVLSYLYWFMKEMNNTAVGVAQKFVSLGTIRSSIIPLPPLAEQKRIADKVSALFAQLDAIDKAYDEYRELQQTMKSRLFEQAIQGKLTDQRKEDGTAQDLYNQIQEEKQRLIKEKKIKKEKPLPEITTEEIPFKIPENWMWVRLNDIVGKTIKRGKSPKYSTVGDVLVFAQKCNTKPGKININLAKKLDFSVLKKYPEEEFMKSGDIVINSTGNGTMGRVGFFTDKDNPDNLKIVPDSHVTIIRVLHNFVDSKYVFCYLKTLQPLLGSSGDGSTNQKELKPHKIASLWFPLPPLAEQKRIVEKLDKLLPLCEA